MSWHILVDTTFAIDQEQLQYNKQDWNNLVDNDTTKGKQQIDANKTD